jgi:hypothetical protein
VYRDAKNGGTVVDAGLASVGNEWNEWTEWTMRRLWKRKK